MNNVTVAEVLPTCFILTIGVEDVEYANFISRFNELDKKNFVRERVPAKHCQDNWWLIKPANMNQGRGIKIYNTIKEIYSFLAQQQPNSIWVAQKYLEKPLLYKDRKFDIRLWVLVTSNNEIYYYKKSYVRTSSSSYELGNTQDYVAHLTNNCFQVQSESYGKHEDGNIITLEALETYIQKTKQSNYNLDEHFFPWAVNHCIDVIVSGQKKMKKVPSSYELFGFDLMIDEDLRVWLIECNVNPHLGMPNDMMKARVPSMLNEMLTIVIDPVIPPKVVPSEYETGNWKLAYSSATKNSREHIVAKSCYPMKEFAVPRTYTMTAKANEDSKKKKFSEYTVDDNLMRKNVSLRIGNTPTFNMINPKKFKAYSIDNIKELITKQVASAAVDEFQLAKNIDRVFACIANWELYSDEQVRSAVKAVKSVLDTPFDYLVVNQSNVSILLSILKAEEVKFDLILELIEMLRSIIEKRKLKLRLTSSVVEILDVLARALFCFLKGEDSFLFPKIFSNIVCTTIQSMCEDNDRQIYVPGESNEKDLLLMEVILGGGIVSLLSGMSLIKEEELQKKLSAFLEKLDYDDLSLQIELLEAPAEEIYSSSGIINTSKVMSLPSVKQMQKRLQKIVERACISVNKQIEISQQSEILSANEANTASDEEVKLTDSTGTPFTAIQGPDIKITSEHRSDEQAKLDSSNTPIKRSSLFFMEWQEHVDKKTIIDQLASHQAKKLEDKEKQKAREQKKIDLYDIVK